MEGRSAVEIVRVKQISESLYMLNEHLTETISMTMMLVVGKERGAIIDTGYGLSGDLSKAIKRITSKPVICLLTHSDPDHAGGAALFDNIYMSNKEQRLLEGGSINPFVRYQTAKSFIKDKETIRYIKTNMVKAKTFHYTNVKDGDMFDLGGCVLEAISFPGHTEGSMCFFNRQENYCVVGDAVANVNSPVLFFDKCLPLEVYKHNLIKFSERVGHDCDLYAGHSQEALPKTIISEILILCDEILAGNTKDDVPYTPPFMLPPPKDAGIIRRIMGTIGNKIASKKLINGAVPMEHKHPGYVTSIKYNQKKIYS